MKKFVLVISIFLVFVTLIMANQVVSYQGEKVIVRDGAMNWQHLNGNPSGRSFEDNLNLIGNVLKNTFPKVITQEAIRKYKAQEYDYLILGKGFAFDGGTFGGKKPGSKTIIESSQIKIDFDTKLYAKCVRVYYDPERKKIVKTSDLLNSGVTILKRFSFYFFKDGYAGHTQCSNLNWKIEDIIPVKIKAKPVPCYPDTVKIIQTMMDTVFVKSNETESKPVWKISTWLSHSQDHFNNTLSDSLDYGYYHLTNVHTNQNNLIWTLMGNFTAKLCLGNWAIVSAGEGGYDDGPYGYQLHLFGVEKSWGNRFYFQLGPEIRYREWSYWKKEIISQIDPLISDVRYVEHWVPIYSSGFYSELNWLNTGGRNHFRTSFSQNYRQPRWVLETGTTEISSSLKLELSSLYLYGGAIFKNMPATVVDSLHVPFMDQKTAEGRIGVLLGYNWILFARHREIAVRSFTDQYNLEWNKYIRKDYSLGLIYRPELFDNSNIQAELIAGYSDIHQYFQNSYANTKDELMEIKFTLSYWFVIK